jgi:hypothetical protein
MVARKVTADIVRITAGCWRKVGLAALAAFVCATCGIPPASGQCVSDTVGVGVELANGTSWASFGQALGQTFYASDTLIQSITVWRPANYGQIVLGLNLFIDYVPITQPALIDCGVVRVLDSDPPGGPVPMTWYFDPPLSLPGKRGYLLWWQVEDCNVLDYPLLYHVGSDAYRNGTCLYTMRGFPDCVQVPNVQGVCPSDVDQCFRVVFCRDATTPTRRTTWGTLKLLYR